MKIEALIFLINASIFLFVLIINCKKFLFFLLIFRNHIFAAANCPEIVGKISVDYICIGHRKITLHAQSSPHELRTINLFWTSS
jgi:hypothetical protein